MEPSTHHHQVWNATMPVILLVFTALKRTLRRLCFNRCLSASGPGGDVSPLRADTPPATRGRPPWADTPLPSACWDTVNKCAVRIPLECILVLVFKIQTILIARVHRMKIRMSLIFKAYSHRDTEIQWHIMWKASFTRIVNFTRAEVFTLKLELHLYLCLYFGIRSVPVPVPNPIQLKLCIETIR